MYIWSTPTTSIRFDGCPMLAPSRGRRQRCGNGSAIWPIESGGICRSHVKLIFLNRFFYPDHSATSQMLSDLAFALAEDGCEVAVITSRQRYDAPTNSLPARETVGGVSIYRIWTSRFGRADLIGRMIDYATFYFSVAWRLWRLTGRGDVVIAKTDPPMLSVVAAPLCWLRNARLVNWLQDIFPETAQVLGVGGRRARTPFRLMQWLRTWSLKAADMNVVL